MSDDVDNLYVKPPDFASVYADGVILQVGDDLSRLMFYQREVDPTEDGMGIEKEKERVVLKFEVRIPRYTLELLAENASELLKLKEEAFNMEQRHKKDEKVLASWYDLDTKIQRFIYNTDEDEIDSKEVEALEAQYNDLRARTWKPRKGQSLPDMSGIEPPEESGRDESHAPS